MCGDSSPGLVGVAHCYHHLRGAIDNGSHYVAMRLHAYLVLALLRICARCIT